MTTDFQTFRLRDITYREIKKEIPVLGGSHETVIVCRIVHVLGASCVCLTDAWYAVMKCVKPIVLRTELRISTWQEVAQAAPAKLRAFLATKYGIDG